jgi:chromosome segregation ATPase
MEAENKETKNTKEGAYEENKTSEYDEYVDDTHYHGYKQNTKKDAGATRFNRKPLHKITLEDTIPEEPQEKHDKPNDSHYKKELEKINQDIETHKKNKEDLHEKLRQEKIGANPELNKCHEDLKVIKAELEPIEKQIEEINKKITGPLAEEKKCKIEKEKLEKELDQKDYEKMQWEVEQIQEQLGFGTLTASEEKKLMDKKSRLEVQLPKCKKLKMIKDKMKKIKAENNGPYALLKVQRDLKGKHIQNRKTIHAKIDILKSTVTENKQAVEQIKVQIDSVKTEIKSLNDKYYALEHEWNDKWKKYEIFADQMEYIREARKKQNDIKKYAEKMARKNEKDAKKDAKTGDDGEREIELVKSGDTEESKTCKSLIAYFQSVIGLNKGEKAAVVQSENKMSDKLSEDLKKGALTTFNREEVNSTQEIFVEGKKTKKVKGPKVSKREQKSMNTDLLIVDIILCAQIKALGLIIPDKKSQVEVFIQALETKLSKIIEAENVDKNQTTEKK